MTDKIVFTELKLTSCLDIAFQLCDESLNNHFIHEHCMLIIFDDIQPLN